ncbi:translation initiation factor 1 (eIF-1/SUI1) [Natronobacterium gregoryi]|uniref:Translation initiation factor eIF-1/SUI1-like protein n=2 Tax=Natronobacterium gregoryi TaxID=44930 RepID=L0AIA8_NATGS|nr:translation initiation factor eIF-1/SUI1-like protein [Natronobacterium gregoryi SP2]SFI67092.1 translation initiation factor 1 (eIF-1/SUI1) [Natronobacterium gregoryi]
MKPNAVVWVHAAVDAWRSTRAIALEPLSRHVSNDDDELEDLLDELDSQGDLDASQQMLSIRTESRRYDKPVTIIEGFDLEASEIETLASELKQSLGTGGTVDDGRIELQGDHRSRVPELLQERGYEVRE